MADRKQPKPEEVAEAAVRLDRQAEVVEAAQLLQALDQGLEVVAVRAEAAEGRSLG